MKEKIKKYWWIIIIILISGFAFYWYEMRPSNIRMQCSSYLSNGILGLGKSIVEKERNYENCLRQHGLEK